MGFSLLWDMFKTCLINFSKYKAKKSLKIQSKKVKCQTLKVWDALQFYRQY